MPVPPAEFNLKRSEDDRSVSKVKQRLNECCHGAADADGAAKGNS